VRRCNKNLTAVISRCRVVPGLADGASLKGGSMGYQYVAARGRSVVGAPQRISTICARGELVRAARRRKGTTSGSLAGKGGPRHGD
jgi:hypothetical protein